PSLGAHSIIRAAGAPLGLALTLATLGAVAWATLALERRRHGALAAARDTGSLWAGPWSLTFGALALAAVVVATFVILGRPWGITSAFPLWGVKILDGVGVPIGEWNGWSERRIDASVFANSTSVMNFGVMLGALAAAGLAGRFAPVWRLSARDVGTAIIGGLMMGYGARLAYGCNIGGFIGGVVSGSLHGWWWLLFGYLGSGVGVRLRAWIGMDPPLDPPSPAPTVQPA
ncbi:MAG: YeeE/YedE family protein, partial [Rhodobacteraceae bacterium]|nr:YeeE/YedE family protein [Paracoccaceae bacterium]